jgi:hypothetical protein
VADRSGDGLELLAGPGAPRVDDVVKHKAALVRGVVRAGEPFGPTPVWRHEIAEILGLVADGLRKPRPGGK